MLIIRSQRPAKIVDFVKNNDASSVYGTPGDTWKRYLSRNGGSGSTFYELETSYAQAKGGSGGVIGDIWGSLVASLGIGVGVLRQRLRAFLDYIFNTGTYYLLQEDGSSHFILEDASGVIILE